MFKYPSSWVNRYCGTGSDNKKAQWFKKTIDAMQYWYGAFIISDYIPYLRWVTKLKGLTPLCKHCGTKYQTLLQK